MFLKIFHTVFLFKILGQVFKQRSIFCVKQFQPYLKFQDLRNLFPFLCGLIFFKDKININLCNKTFKMCFSYSLKYQLFVFPESSKKCYMESKLDLVHRKCQLLNCWQDQHQLYFLRRLNRKAVTSYRCQILNHLGE